MSHSSSSGSGGKINLPIKKILTGILILTATLLIRSVAKAQEFSPMLTAWTTLISFVVFSWAGYKLAWENKHGHVGGAHGHGGHGTSWWVLGLAVIAMTYLTLQVWWFAESHWGKSADKIKEVRVEERKRLERLVDAVDQETGLFTGKRYTRIAPIVDPASVPRHETTSVPSGFSDPIPLPSNATFRWDTVGPSGDLLVWDGRRIWLCKDGEKNAVDGATSLSFASITNHPIRLTVIVTPKPYTY